MIEVRNVCFKYNSGTNVLEDISIDIKEGELISIIR